MVEREHVKILSAKGEIYDRRRLLSGDWSCVLNIASFFFITFNSNKNMIALFATVLIQYLLYNRDLHDIPTRRQLSFIDDILYWVQSKRATANALKLEQLLVKQNNGEHNIVPKFEKSKYILIHFAMPLQSEWKHELL